MTLRTLSLAVLAALALPVHAQTARTLDEVIVTANRVPVAVRDAIAAVEVIDREEIERSQAISVPDLLRGRAGISIGNQGGQGKLSTLFLRGAESDHVLVLVDGVRVGSATSGLVALQDLPIELIERIEIVRGPRSSLYGSEAIGGVIQIFTRRDQGAVAPRLVLGVGSEGSYEAGVGVGGSVGQAWFGADYVRTHSDGINACRGYFIPPYFGGGCFTDEPDRDGYTRDSLSLRGGVELGEALELEARALLVEAENEYDGSWVNRSEVSQQVFGATATWTPSPVAALTLALGRNRDASDNFLGTIYRGYFDTFRDSVVLQGDFVLDPRQRLSAGVEWLEDSVRSNTGFVEKRRDNAAVFAQYLADFDPLDLQASVRHDDNEQFGEHVTGNLAAGFDLTEDWRFTVATGNAFKAPTFNELYYPYGYGNPLLDPERSRTIEAGITWAGGAAVVQLDAYRTNVDDLIAYDSVLRKPNNIQEARLQGAELSAETEIAGWTAYASYSVVDAENRTPGPAFGNELPRRAAQSARIALDRDFGRLQLGVTASGEGERYDDVANSARLGSYGLVDLRAAYELTPAWTVAARIGNVFDRGYETVEYYNQLGRTWFVTVRYAPL